MKSMTGFGRGEYKNEGYGFVVEIKTINHRYRDFFIRMPKQLNSIEDRIRKEVNKYVSRGRVEIYISLDTHKEQQKNIKLDLALATSYHDALDKIKQHFPTINQNIDLGLIARAPEVIQVEEGDYNIEELWESLYVSLNNALLQLDNVRMEEGKHLKKDLLNRCTKIEERVKNIGEIAPRVEEEYKRNLTEKIMEYTNNIEIDETRLMTEVAIFADKVSIAEEITRLDSHIKQFIQALNEEVVGRKLDFIVQEMNREINTIGSKGNNYDISSEVVAIKSELEKIREQIQNIE